MKDPETKKWLDLNSDEKIKYWEHPTIIKYLPGLIGGFVVGFFGLFTTIQFPEFGLFPLLLVPLGLSITVYEYLKWVRTHYIMTTRRIVKKVGVLSLSVDELKYDDVTNTNDTQSFFERILKFGTIKIYTAGTSEAEMVFEQMPKFNKGSDILSSHI